MRGLARSGPWRGVGRVELGTGFPGFGRLQAQRVGTVCAAFSAAACCPRRRPIARATAKRVAKTAGPRVGGRANAAWRYFAGDEAGGLGTTQVSSGEPKGTALPNGSGHLTARLLACPRHATQPPVPPLPPGRCRFEPDPRRGRPVVGHRGGLHPPLTTPVLAPTATAHAALATA